MKKNPNAKAASLKLNKDTLRTLTPSETKSAAGGWNSAKCTNGPSTVTGTKTLLQQE